MKILSGSTEKPIVDRFLVHARCTVLVTATVLLFTPVIGAASNGPQQQRLTEAASLHLALQRPSVRALADSRIALARSEVTAVGTLPNPEIEYVREEVDRPTGDSTEDSFWLSQRIDLSGRRGLQVAAAEYRVEAATLQAQADRLAIEADTRARFFRVLHQQERLDAIDGWTARLAAVAEVIRKRQMAGEVSGYDALRLSAERSAATAAMQKERAAYRRAWEELAAYTGGADKVGDYAGVVGRLLPAAPPSLETLLEALTRRPDVVQLAREAMAHDFERRAGERGWVPELTFGIGHRMVDDDLGSDSGPMIGAGITIPLFDRGQAIQQRASASAAIARNQHLLTLATAGGEVRGLWNEVTHLTGTAWQQHTAARDESTALAKIAEAAYRGGEIGVLELLDAYRAVHDAELKALETAAAARQADVELDRLTGGLVR